MTRAHSISTSGTEDERTQVLGRRIWRVVPYIKPYWLRAMTGIFSNGMARFSDLLPFVFIGFAVDYYSGNMDSGAFGSMRMWLDENLFPLMIINKQTVHHQLAGSYR